MIKSQSPSTLNDQKYLGDMKCMDNHMKKLDKIVDKLVGVFSLGKHKM